METFKEQNEKINQTYYDHSEAVERCLECHRTCLSCLQHCLALGGKHADYKHISLMLECADMCRLTSDFIESNSMFLREVAELCARICDACADSLNQVDPEDGHMIDCVLVCRSCAETSRGMELLS